MANDMDIDTLKALPPTAQIRYMRDCWVKEAGMRRKVLRGSDAQKKITEAEACAALCDHLLSQWYSGKG